MEQQNASRDEQDIFINRELSWLEFNRRVLDLAKDKGVPLGEQLKFASIYASNLDEFFMVRVGSLYDQTLLADSEAENKTGMTAAEQLNAIMPVVADVQQRCDKIMDKLYVGLAEHGCTKVNFKNLSKDDTHFWKKYFLSEFFPVLSPQIIDRRHPFPFLRNNEVYVGAVVRAKGDAAESFGLIPVSAQFGRVVFVQNGKGMQFALVEELILHFAALVFGRKLMQNSCVFRVTRNADITVDEGMFDHDIDYCAVMSELLKKRRKLAAVRLLVSASAPQEMVTYLRQKLLLPLNSVFRQTSPLDLSIGFKLAAHLATLGDTGLFYPVRRPMQPPKSFKLSEAVARQDVLMQYPYQSIRPFILLLMAAANDPDVVSIKMTLYRVACDSQIIEALIAAAENGKEVVAMVELRARFDEQNNIDFSKQLEEAGCTVIYGFADFKVHSKLCLITKMRGNQLEYISQIGTGNYNEKTSEQYTDISFITSNAKIGAELAAVFNNLAIERLTENVSDLLVAPLCFKSVLMGEMDAEIAAKRMGKDASIVLKCNSISDKDIIEKISEASCAGVCVKMIVRGICCLQAGVPGKTENVTVRSIVGRYLEHSRVYQFGTGSNQRVYIASGDFLTRNTQRRVEAGVRITNRRIVSDLNFMLELQWADNVNAREMQADGSYVKVKAPSKDAHIDSQLAMYQVLENAWPTVYETPQTRQVEAEQARIAPKMHPQAPVAIVKPVTQNNKQPLSNVLPLRPTQQKAQAVRPVRSVYSPRKPKSLLFTIINNIIKKK